MSQDMKEALKALRQERAEYVKAAKERIKRQNQDMKKIKEQLAAGGPQTVPELAQATGLDSAAVLWYLTAMRKYGQAVEGDKKGDYFQYSLAQ